MSFLKEVAGVEVPDVEDFVEDDFEELYEDMDEVGVGQLCRHWRAVEGGGWQEM